MGLLLVSLAALAIGPLLVFFAGRTRATAVFIDAFVLVVVGGLVVLHVLPQSLVIGGWPALALVAVGILIPTIAERGLRPGRSGRAWLIAMALTGLGLHTMLDGVALSGGGEHHGHSHDPLVWAVILHRIPEGISIWWIASRTLGMGIGVLTMGVTMAGTVAGFTFGADVMAGDSAGGIALFQALLSGSLLHIVLHDHVPAPRDVAPSGHVSSVLGLLAAIALLAIIDHDHAAPGAGEHVHGAGDVFMTLALETAPVLLLAYLAVGFAQVFLPRGWLDRMNRGSTFQQALRGVAVGLPLPVCSCGVVPIYRGLIAKGASIGAAIAFLIATPELEIAAILLTFQLMGVELAVARVVLAAGLALGVGVLLGALAESRHVHTAACSMHELEPPLAGAARVRAALRAGLCEGVDHTAAWILVGLGLSALLLPYLDPAVIASLPAGIDVPLAALLGLPVYVCASGSTPLAAVLIHQGLSPGAALAFLLTGPATNITTFGVLNGLHGKRLAVMFVVAMMVGATVFGYLVNLVLPNVRIPAVLDQAHEHVSVFNAVCLAAFALLVLSSLLRMGTRGFIGQLFLPPTRETVHAHAHAEPPACH